MQLRSCIGLLLAVKCYVQLLIQILYSSKFFEKHEFFVSVYLEIYIYRQFDFSSHWKYNFNMYSFS